MNRALPVVLRTQFGKLIDDLESNSALSRYSVVSDDLMGVTTLIRSWLLRGPDSVAQAGEWSVDQITQVAMIEMTRRTGIISDVARLESTARSLKAADLTRASNDALVNTFNQLTHEFSEVAQALGDEAHRVTATLLLPALQQYLGSRQAVFAELNRWPNDIEPVPQDVRTAVTDLMEDVLSPAASIALMRLADVLEGWTSVEDSLTGRWSVEQVRKRPRTVGGYRRVHIMHALQDRQRGTRAKTRIRPLADIAESIRETSHALRNEPAELRADNYRQAALLLREFSTLLAARIDRALISMTPLPTELEDAPPAKRLRV